MWDFWSRLSESEISEGLKPLQYIAIRIYSNDDEFSGHLAFHYEFRAQYDFKVEDVPRIWEWLFDSEKSRSLFDFDSADEFIQALGEEINSLFDQEDDAIEHLRKLPEMVLPESFDRIDDSIFNDQNDLGEK